MICDYCKLDKDINNFRVMTKRDNGFTKPPTGTYINETCTDCMCKIERIEYFKWFETD